MRIKEAACPDFSVDVELGQRSICRSGRREGSRGNTSRALSKPGPKRNVPSSTRHKVDVADQSKCPVGLIPFGSSLGGRVLLLYGLLREREKKGQGPKYFAGFRTMFVYLSSCSLLQRGGVQKAVLTGHLTQLGSWLEPAISTLKYKTLSSSHAPRLSCLGICHPLWTSRLSTVGVVDRRQARVVGLGARAIRVASYTCYTQARASCYSHMWLLVASGTHIYKLA